MIMETLQKRQLGQLRPSDTTATSIYTPPGSNTLAEISSIVVCNTSGAAASFSIFLDPNGSTYDETTALVWLDEITTFDIIQFEVPIPIISGGNLAVKSSSGNAFTFTVFGLEKIN
jgi:hypothetical protein